MKVILIFLILFNISCNKYNKFECDVAKKNNVIAVEDYSAFIKVPINYEEYNDTIINWKGQEQIKKNNINYTQEIIYQTCLL